MKKIVTDEIKEKMRAMEKDGKSRKQIADEFKLHQSTVTKALGAVRQYRGARLPQPA